MYDMKKYKVLLLLPIFKNLKFCQNIIFNQNNFITRSNETRSLVSALNSIVIFEKILNISIPKPSSFLSSNLSDEIKNNFNLDYIDLVIIDCSLSPIQHRNLEKI